MYKYIILACISFQMLEAAYQEPPAKPVIQYRPQRPDKLPTSDEVWRKQLTEIDREIHQLAAEREDLRGKAENASQMAESLLERYQEEIERQKRFQNDMQTIDDKIAGLVRKKEETAKRLKK